MHSSSVRLLRALPLLVWLGDSQIMRLALLSDIYGNLHALDAVLNELAHEQIEQYNGIVEFRTSQSPRF